MTIQVTRSSMPTLEDYIEEIKPIFRQSRQLTNMGPVYKKFQHALIDYLKVQYLSLFTNGHLALETAIPGTGIKKKKVEKLLLHLLLLFQQHMQLSEMD